MRLASALLVVALLATAGAVAAIIHGARPASAGCQNSGSYSTPDLAVGGRELRASVVRHPDALPPLAGTYTVTVRDVCDGSKHRVAYRRLKGVPPEIALAESRQTVYVARDRLINLDGFPLRAALYGDEQILHRLPRTCSRRLVRRTLTLTAEPGPFELATRGAGGAPVRVEVPRTTDVTGRRTFGQPDLRRGDRLVVTGRSCRLSNPRHARRVRAMRITAPA